jgi:hypothetical protein
MAVGVDVYHVLDALADAQARQEGRRLRARPPQDDSLSLGGDPLEAFDPLTKEALS